MSDVTRLIRVGDMTVDTDKRTVFGTLIPYNETAMVKDPGRPPYKERFAPGAFTDFLRHKSDAVRLYGMHSRNFGGKPVGKPVEWSDGPDKLCGGFELFDTTEGNDTLTLIREGGYTGFSIGFGLTRDGTRQDGDIVTRTRATLGEVSVVDVPAYPSATIDGIRIAFDPALDAIEPDNLAAWLELLPEATRVALLDHARSLPDEASGGPAPTPLVAGCAPEILAAAQTRLLTLKGN